MKKIMILSCLVLSTSIAALAQLPSFTAGIKAGVNYSSLKTKNDLTDQNGIMGYQVGVFTRIGGGGFYVQPELYLGSKGNDFIKVQNGTDVVAATGKVRFTTLDIPVLLGTKIGVSKLNLRFMAGPVLSFLVDKNTTFDSAYDNLKDYKNQAIALQAGAGVDIANLSVDLRYEAGLSNINKSDTYSQKQNLFHLSLGYKLF
jgi:Outer membrane protein beta-barrel domain